MMRKGWWLFGLVGAVWTALVFATAAVITYVMPRKYESVALVEVHPSLRLDGKPPENAFSIQDEIRRMGGAEVAMEVVDELDLSDRWRLDENEAAEVVSKLVSLTSPKGTNQVRVVVRHSDREDAKMIAAAVIAAYGKLRREVEFEPVERRMLSLSKVLQEQEKRVEELRMVVVTFGRVYGYRSDHPSFVKASEEYKSEKKKLDQGKRQMLSDSILRNMNSRPLVVIGEPVLAAAPVSPNVCRNLALGAAAGLVTSLIPAFLLTWLVYGRKRSTPVAPADHGYSRS